MNATLVLLAMLIGFDAAETPEPTYSSDEFRFDTLKFHAVGSEPTFMVRATEDLLLLSESVGTLPEPGIEPSPDVLPDSSPGVPADGAGGKKNQEESKEKPSVGHYRFTFLPERPIHGAAASGQFGIFAFDLGPRYASDWTAADQRDQHPLSRGQFNYRSWTGPGNPSLPSNAFRIGFDFPLEIADKFEFGFTPAIVSDFDGHLNSDGYNWDFRAIGFTRKSPDLLFVWGMEFWNRVHNTIVPHAGIVWTPNERFILQLMAPQSRISYRLGTCGETAMWAYGCIEYDVEAYQISLTSPVGRDEKIQLDDYRAVFGIRSEQTGLTGFVEAGWVFNRHVKFLHGTPGFNIDPGFVGSIGLRY
ncbi:MAG: hypothetical protein HY290_13305 [Planctomycetia bacterium]|nr:hypothetical protein [Planctomycetia bacterium]